MLSELFETFIREKLYLKNVSKLTVRSYRQAFERFNKQSTEINKAALNDFVINMRESGLEATTCNIAIRSMNSFLTWLFENGHTTERLRIQLLKAKRTTIKAYEDSEIKRILSYKPKNLPMWRLQTLLSALIDTGCRIDELLNLKRSDIDFDNHLMTVVGKGNKERLVPFSVELKKVLSNYLRKHTFDYVFATKKATKPDYRTVLKQWERLCKKLKIEFRGFHSLRHNFALNFIREGGDVFTLRRILGHSSIQTTQIYVNLQTVDLQKAHAKTSILSRLR